jgi:hypothetical protein
VIEEIGEQATHSNSIVIAIAEVFRADPAQELGYKPAEVSPAARVERAAVVRDWEFRERVTLMPPIDLSTVLSADATVFVTRLKTMSLRRREEERVELTSGEQADENIAAWCSEYVPHPALI